MFNSFAPYFSSFEPVQVYSIEDEKKMLPGVWQTQYQLGMLLNQDELVFQNDGNYSCNSVSNGMYAMWLAGKWEFIGQGMVRVVYSDYSPKMYGGNPIHISQADTFHLKFIDSNRMVLLGLNAVANRIA